MEGGSDADNLASLGHARLPDTTRYYLDQLPAGCQLKANTLSSPPLGHRCRPTVTCATCIPAPLKTLAHREPTSTSPMSMVHTTTVSQPLHVLIYVRSHSSFTQNKMTPGFKVDPVSPHFILVNSIRTHVWTGRRWCHACRCTKRASGLPLCPSRGCWGCNPPVTRT